MYILGLKASGHDCAAAISKNGILIAAASEERFDRIKHSPNFPINSIAFCLESAGLSDINEVNEISIGYDYDKAARLRSNFLENRKKPTIDPKDIAQEKIQQKKKILNTLSSKYNYKGDIYFVDHHLCHAASAFYTSGFNSAAILTIDGIGEYDTAKIYINEGSELIQQIKVAFPHSIGHVYEATTNFLGFRGNGDEGKIMGLSALGTPDYYDIFSQIIFPTDEGFEINESYFANLDDLSPPKLAAKFEKIVGRPRKQIEAITQRDKNIAASLQKVTNEIVVHMATLGKGLRNDENLVYAGGVALNGVANQEIVKSKIFNQIFIQPAASDDGVSIGASLLPYYKNKDSQKNSATKFTPYLGKSYTDQDIEKALKEFNLTYKKSTNIEIETAKLLSENKIVGWFQGRFEMGPRALGNRSIFANPKEISMKDMINRKVKYRESFRPFAPAILENRFEEIFGTKSVEIDKYMLRTCKVTKEWQEKIPAVLHVDNTARPQTVSENSNNRFHKLLVEFDKLTGIPVLLNTSFNKQEPIVNSPKEAIKCFLNTDIDILVLGDYIVNKHDVR